MTYQQQRIGKTRTLCWW